MSILDDIVARKIVEVERLPDMKVNVDGLRDKLEARGKRDFVAALRNPRAGDVALIAEVKKASPSAGVIRADFDPVLIAREYESAGASCLSVLTDEEFFQGSLTYLRDIRSAVDLPLLRKDFIIDERQIAEAVEWGADAVLLIAAILDDDKLARFHNLAVSAGLAVLVEVHDSSELECARSIDAELIGINNRNLKNFTVDLSVTTKIAEELVDWSGMLVAESGIHSREDVERLAACGAGAILVGESLMRETDLCGKAHNLLGIS